MTLGKRLSLLILLLHMGFLLLPGYPAEKDENSDKPVGRATIIVVAEDQPEPLRLEGRDVIVLDPGQAREMGMHSVADVLKFYAELNLVTTGVMPGSVTSSFIRGGESSYTLVVVDDMEVNTPGGFYDLSNLPLENIERIEILKGPGSTIYGSEAVAGVIRIYTRKGTPEHQLSLSFQGGSFSTFEESLQVNGPLSKSIRYSVGVSRLDSDRQRPINDDYRRTSASIQLSSAGSGSHAWKLNYRLIDARTHFPTQDSGDLFDILDPNQYTDTTEHVIGFQWTGNWTRRMSTRFTAGYYRSELDFVDADDGPEIDPFGGFESHTQQDRWRFDGRLSYRIGSHHLSWGVQYEREHSEMSNLFSPEPRSFERNQFSLYALDQFKGFNDRLGITAGVRWESHDDYENVVTPQISVAYWLSKELKVRGSAGYGFKAPSFFQVHGFPGFVEGNPDLEPEKNIGWDAGLEYWLDGNQPLVRVTYFENHFKDIIEFVFDTDPTTPNYFNVQEAVARGLEISFEYMWKNWQARVGYTYVHTETIDAGLVQSPGDAFVEGEPLLRRPKHRMTVSAGYVTNRLSVFLNILYQGSRWDLDFSQGFVPVRVKLDDYIRVDAKARYQLTRMFGLIVRIENLFDTDYQEVFGFRGNGFGLYGGLDINF